MFHTRSGDAACSPTVESISGNTCVYLCPFGTWPRCASLWYQRGYVSIDTDSRLWKILQSYTSVKGKRHPNNWPLETPISRDRGKFPVIVCALNDDWTITVIIFEEVYSCSFYITTSCSRCKCGNIVAITSRAIMQNSAPRYILDNSLQK